MWSAFSGGRFYLDANAIIYALETGFDLRGITQAFLAAVDERVVLAVTSEVTIAEVLVKPLQTSDLSTLAMYERCFSPASQIELVPVDRPLILASARISALLGMKLIDAMHVPTAQLSECDYFLTHDERLGRALPERPKWLRFSDITA
jgi:predicted nucleic acid-binding protein